jgi:hypothetical protein
MDSSESMSTARASAVEFEVGALALSSAMGASARDGKSRTPSRMWYGFADAKSALHVSKPASH